MRHLLIKFSLCLLLVSNVVQAGEMDACYEANFKQIDRMKDLPPDVLGLIYANRNGEKNLSAMSMSKEEQSQIKLAKVHLGIADRGGPFSPSCSPIGNEASLRLVMAAYSPECILVTIEHGGAGHGAGLRIFMRENDTWVRGDKFEHPRAQLMYEGAFKTDLPTFITQANYQLGRAIQHGMGMKKAPVESLKWYLLAANQGHIGSQFQLGKIYAEGKGAEKSIGSALSWIEKAAKENAAYEHRLGVLYIKGKRIPQNIKVGLQKVKSAATRGNHSAQTYLGKLYVKGEHVKKDYSQATQLFRKSVHGGGRTQLAKMYKNGLGVRQSNVAAWALLSRNRYRGLPEIEKEMTQQELQAAKQLKNEMDGYYTKESKYTKPKGILIALDAYLEQH